jgi:protein phosphatase
MKAGSNSLLGVFDGLGGEECGEIASLLAAKCATNIVLSKKPTDTLLQFCKEANDKICEYAADNNIISMGTTAAILAFAKNKIALCNIGDSKIFRFADEKLQQISIDHYAVTKSEKKPPLSQNLGIPTSEMIIEPYIAVGQYNDGDIYLLCSDGLTDMVSIEEIKEILLKIEFDKAVNRLLEKALENGGKDNITIILCRVEKDIQKIKTKWGKRHGK